MESNFKQRKDEDLGFHQITKSMACNETNICLNKKPDPFFMIFRSLVMLCFIALLYACSAPVDSRVVRQNFKCESSNNTRPIDNMPTGQQVSFPTRKTKADRAKNPIQITLKDRQSGRFQITNNSRQTISLSSLFMKGSAEMFPDIFPDKEGDFFPHVLRFGLKKDGRWVYSEHTANAISYNYPLAAGKSLDFMLSPKIFKAMGVPRGEFVRLGFDGYLSKPFKW